MGNRLSIIFFLLLSICLVTGGYSANKKADKPARFNFTPIKDTNYILTQSDLKGKTLKKIEVKKGKVIPGRQFGIKGTGRLNLLIGGSEIVVFMKKTKPIISIDGREKPLKTSVAS